MPKPPGPSTGSATSTTTTSPATDTVTATDTALALWIPERTAARLVAEARTLTHQHPTLNALENGSITYRHASIIVEEILSLPDGTPAKTFESTLLNYAQDHTPTTLTNQARKLREKVHPKTITTRHHRCVYRFRCGYVQGDVQRGEFGGQGRGKPGFVLHAKFANKTAHGIGSRLNGLFRSI